MSNLKRTVCLFVAIAMAIVGCAGQYDFSFKESSIEFRKDEGVSLKFSNGDEEIE